MSHDAALQLIGQMLVMAAMIAAPILIANLVVGVGISLVQAVTQVQEMTLTFVPKLAVTVAVALVFGGWMMEKLESYARDMFVNVALQGL